MFTADTVSTVRQTQLAFIAAQLTKDSQEASATYEQVSAEASYMMNALLKSVQDESKRLMKIKELIQQSHAKHVETVSTLINDQHGGQGGSLYAFERINWLENRMGRAYAGLRWNIAMVEVVGEFVLGMMDFTEFKMIPSASLKIGFAI